MGCGKSTIGRLLADQLQVAFLDSDEEIARQTGMSIREIFETKGEPAFRELERSFVQQLDPAKKCVIAVGGGLPCYHALMDSMKELGTVIYLETKAETLVQRLESEREQRPLLREANDLETYIRQKLAERVVYYQQAHYSVATDNVAVEELVVACAEIIR